MSSAKKTIERIFNSKEAKCHWCNIELNFSFPSDGVQKADNATLDHIIPRGIGGGNWNSNLVVACYSCNHKRKDTIPNKYHCDRCKQAIIHFITYMKSIISKLQ